MTDFNVSIIIPANNRIDYLKYSISSLKKQTYTKDCIEIIVVDNGSTDGTKEWIEEQKNDLCIIYEKVDKVYLFEAAKMRNIGVEKAKGNIIIFLDSDIIVPPDFVENHLSYYENYDDMICVIGRVIYLKDDPITLLDINDISNLRKKSFDYVDPLESDILYCNENLHCHPTPWMICHSGNISSTKYCIEKCGKFDEWHRRWSIEDIDFGYSLFNNNVKMFFSNSAYGLHKYHELCTGKEKIDSIKEGYKYLISKNKENVYLEKIINHQLDELHISEQGGLLTERFRREKYKFLKKLVFPNYLLPKITFAMHVTKKDLVKALNIMNELEKQYSDEIPFEVIIINGSCEIEVEKQFQSLSSSFDLRLFNLDWTKEIQETFVDSLYLKNIMSSKETFSKLENKLIQLLYESNDLTIQYLRGKLEEYTYHRAFGKFIKYLEVETTIGPMFIKNIASELKL